MNLDRSIDFLLDRASPVIRYRLHKHILKDLTPTSEQNLLQQIYATPHFQLLQNYVKPNGYIGIGMHSWDKFKRTPLEDGESAARLLSYYAIPTEHPIVANFVNALRDDTILQAEFSYYKPEVARFENRFRGLNNGTGVMVLVYTMQAMLGHGDDTPVQPFQDTALQAFRSVLPLSSLSDITRQRTGSRARYAYPYIDENEYFPCSYHLTALSYSSKWRSAANLQLMADAINHIDTVMRDDNRLHVKLGSRYYVPLWALCRPFRAFDTTTVDGVMYRRVLSELAMLGAGRRVEVLNRSADAVQESLKADGILRLGKTTAYQKRRLIESLTWPTAYGDGGLEPDYRQPDALNVELTFWAVEFLHLIEQAA